MKIDRNEILSKKEPKVSLKDGVHSNLHHDDLIRAADASLKRLGTKFVDLYMIHWPNPKIPIMETMSAMEELVKAQKIKHIGVSNFSVSDLEDAEKALSSNKIVSNQVEYNLENREIEDDLVPYCKKKKITIVAYSPLSRGHLDGKGDLLSKIAKKNGKTKAQVILNFLTREENVIAIPKADSEEHVRENSGASGWRLSDEDIRTIDEKYS